MRFVHSVIVLSLLALGCGLFKSEPGSSGEHAPTMYGTGLPVPSGGGAGTAGLPDASLPSTGVDGSAGVPSDTSVDLASPTPDTPTHADSRLWTRFPPSSYSFTKCTWFSKNEGYCNDATSMLGTARVYLYKTLDGGATWTFTCAIDSEIPDINANINVYILSQSDFWFVAGSGNVGSVGRSTDGGKNWTSLTNDIAALLASSGSGDAGVPSLPVWQLVAQGGRIWLLPQGPNLAFSPDGGRIWKKFTPPADFGASSKRSLVASRNSLFLQYLTSDGSLGLYSWNGTAFLPAESTLPASSAGSHAGTWSRAWPSAEGAFFADRGPLPAWGSPFAAYATIDRGKSILKILPDLSGSSDIVGLSDGMAFSAYGSVTAYVSGVFTDASGGRFLEIRRTLDAGRTWTTLHSEPSYLGDASFISLSKDEAGEIHAMHFQTSSDGIGPPVIYDAHYVLQ